MTQTPDNHIYKFCRRCGLHMVQGFKGCPRCQTDKYIILTKYGESTTLTDSELKNWVTPASPIKEEMPK